MPSRSTRGRRVDAEEVCEGRVSEWRRAGRTLWVRKAGGKGGEVDWMFLEV